MPRDQLDLRAAGEPMAEGDFNQRIENPHLFAASALRLFSWSRLASLEQKAKRAIEHFCHPSNLEL